MSLFIVSHFYNRVPHTSLLAVGFEYNAIDKFTKFIAESMKMQTQLTTDFPIPPASFYLFMTNAGHPIQSLLQHTNPTGSYDTRIHHYFHVCLTLYVLGEDTSERHCLCTANFTSGLKEDK